MIGNGSEISHTNSYHNIYKILIKIINW